MTRVVTWLAQERNRAYLYRVATAGGAVAVLYGLVSSADVAIWAGLVATGFALPAAKTSTKNESE